MSAIIGTFLYCIHVGKGFSLVNREKKKKTEKISARSFNARVLRINSIYSQSDRCKGGGGGVDENFFIYIANQILSQKEMARTPVEKVKYVEIHRN